MTTYNPDHVRHILTCLADRDYASAFSLTELDLDISDADAITHFGWLLDLGYVEGNPETTANELAPLDYYDIRVTGQGVLFLETFTAPGFYARAKQKAVEIGCGQMPNVLMTIAQTLVNSGG